MNLSRPFILRPVATSLLMVAILLAGMIAYRVLPGIPAAEIDPLMGELIWRLPQASLPASFGDSLAGYAWKLHMKTRPPGGSGRRRTRREP